jgi:peptidylprolyl isomerase
VPAADNDNVGLRHQLSQPKLAKVSLDFVGGTHAGLAGIAAGLAQRSALPKQIPALVERNLHRTQPLLLLRLVDLAVLQLGPQLLLLGDQLVDLSENVLVLSHGSSLPDYRGHVTSNAGQKPEIEFPDGPAPTEMVIKDLVVGDGAEAVPGGNVEVHYVGVEYDTGEEFDSSWNRGESIEFPLRGLIQGWQDGIPGMKVGGRRQLVIPPEQAYGPAGGGHRLSGKTLIFVIDLLATR